MKDVFDECVDCGLPCFSTCPYKNVVRYFCDDCGDETDLYEFDDQELCIDCIKKRLKPINE